MKKNIISNFIFNILFSSILSFSLILSLISSLRLIFDPLGLLALSFVFVLLFSGIFYNKNSLLISSIVSLTIFVSGFIYLIYRFSLSNIVKYILTFCYWLYDFIIYAEPYSEIYARIVLIFLGVLITVISYYFTAKKFNFYILLTFGISVFIVQVIYEIFVSFWAFYIFIFIILIYYFMFVYGNITSSNSDEALKPAIFSLWTIPLCAIIICLSVFIPIKQTPFEWTWLDKKVGLVFNYFNYKFESNEIFSISSTGFGDKNSKLGGKVHLDKTVVLKVESPRQVYLKGIVKDSYTGSQWINTSKEKVIYTDINNRLPENLNNFLNEFDFQRTSTNRRNYRNLNRIPSDFYYNDNVKISYLKLNTKSLFLPERTKKLNFTNENFKVLIDSNGSASSENILNTEFNYSVNVYNFKYDFADFQNYLRSSKRGIYYTSSQREIEMFNTFYNFEIISKNEDSTKYNVYNSNGTINFKNIPQLNRLITIFENLNDIYSKYLQLPDTLPKRVIDLAKTITESSKTDYDKAKKIEEYLSKNFPYTLTPGPIPRNRDFVDYFLFDKNEGYCTYYASAMTVLLRSVGIPSRYVEGYILPSSPKTGTTYEVTNEQSHAWVEVYFEGFGWVPFEPTSPFAATFYNNKEVQAVISNSFMSNASYLDYMKGLQGYGNTNLDLSALNTADSENSDKIYTILIISFITLVLLSFFGALIFNLIKRKIILYRLKSSNNKALILAYYKMFLKILSICGINIIPGETPLQFAERVDKLIIFLPVRFKAITDIFVIARYSENEITIKDRKFFIEFYDNIILKSKNILGKHKYFFNSNLFGRF